MREITCSRCGHKQPVADPAPPAMRCAACGNYISARTGEAAAQPQPAAQPPPPPSAIDQLAAAQHAAAQGAYGRPGAHPPAAARRNAPYAVAALVCGIVGILCAGIILGIIAIVCAVNAKNAIRRNPGMYTGEGMATAGLVLGIIDIIGAIIGLLVFLSRFAK
jgi:hypothetical protein